ncbi:hypothetical protein [Streptomyces sp. NPDC059949]|uniref:hypothetical protein n=1 Tax=Streptomyces sp. NPDC059949 TaxID=3347013 RepID=UPI00364F764B
MAVPDARVELQIAGTWVDVTDDVLHNQTIRYSWGRRGEGSRTDPAAASFTLRNPTGTYSGQNPNSPYYGHLNRNTPVRLSHGGATMALVIPNGVLGRATTPDTAALDITGDIDVRADVTPRAWGGVTSTSSWEVVGKYSVTLNQRSWMLLVNDNGTVQFRWSADGTAVNVHASSIPVPFAPGQRGAIRATLDVNNGSGGWTLTFYTAPTLSGSWTQLGTATVTTAGTTSIFNSTTALEVGDVASLAFANVGREIHAVEVRNGIGGSAVANPVFTSQAEGTTSFADAAGRTWSIVSASITSRRVRVLEASSWTPRWGASGVDVTVPVEAAGILRRLGQGAKALASTLARRLPKQAPVAYWPLEDGSDATRAYSPIAGCPPLRVADFDFASDDSCPGSSALPSIGTAATMHAAIPPYSSPTNGYLVAMLYSIDTMPASKSAWLSIQTTGTGRGIVLNFTALNVVCDVYDSTNTLITSQAFANGALFGPGKWFRFDLTAQVNGGNTDIHLGFVDVEGGGLQWNFSIAGTPGVVTDIDTGFGTELSGMRLGHLGVYPSSNVGIWDSSDNGYRGESAGARVFRLANEESVPVLIASGPGTATAMGPQRPSTLLDLFGECEEADGGILFEDRERAGLLFRTRSTLYSQAPKLTIPYGQLAPPLQPTADDRWLRNDRTVKRPDGSSARAVLTSGALSTAAPPNGVGVYDDTHTLNVHLDSQVQGLAEWLLHRGTWDESRYPTVRIFLHKYSALVPEVCALSPGDIIRITDLPVWLPPGPIDLMVEGAEEIFKTLEWTITLSCSPAGPWAIGVLDDEDLGRLDTNGAELASGVTSTATSLSVATTSGPIWTTASADRPFDIRVGGEVMTVTNVTGASSPQTFTVTRSVNGVVKAHSSAADVRLATPTILAL